MPTVLFQNFPKQHLPYSTKLISQWIKNSVQSEGYNLSKLSFNFLNDEELLKININFLNHNYYTDIITFDYTQNKTIEGEIFISSDRVIENAQSNKVSSEQEFLRVIIHGILHLCGYKDKTKQEQNIIRKKEDHYINLFYSKFSKIKTMKKKNYPDKKHSFQPESLMMSHGYKPELSVDAIKCPIYQTSTFVFHTAEEGKRFFELAYGKSEKKPKEEVGLIYSRLNNPDIEILEDRLCLWDGGDAAAVFESGMAAISTIFFEFLQPGDVFLYSAPLYGGTEHFINHVLNKFGITGIQFNHLQTKKEIIQLIEKENIKNKLKLIYIETPSNPTNTLINIQMCREVADYFSTKNNQIVIAVDNTYLGPLWQHPLKHGADIVVYSATKYIGGHSDLIAGACVGKREHIQRIKTLRSFLGNMAGPWTGWLLLRSLETLKVRMEQQAQNAIKIAQFLSKHPKVEKVLHLSLLDKKDPQYKIFKKQCLSPGAMLSFYVKGKEKQAFKFLNNLQLIHLAVSLGSTESLAEHPATMTHASVPDDEKIKYGITENMIRLSVGIENVDDLIYDINQALNKI
ncbi:MAG: hypothetical protein KatS3mg027_1208 [Bacteroidia bacterium]|nr:MAG: hypothetical protein KatS3mg027_1208 [Bacteroidia bacterium]